MHRKKKRFYSKQTQYGIDKHKKLVVCLAKQEDIVSEEGQNSKKAT